jgi:hypothetical protein
MPLFLISFMSIDVSLVSIRVCSYQTHLLHHPSTTPWISRKTGAVVQQGETHGIPGETRQTLEGART